MMRIGLAVYGTVFSMGIHPASTRPPIRSRQLMDRALVAGLEGVELPASLLQGEDIEDVAQYARNHGLFITLASGGYAPDKLMKDIELGARLGVGTVRTAVGGAKIGGNRRPLAGRWQSFLQEVLTKLREATTFAERAGVNLAVENHQDLASEELLWLYAPSRAGAWGDSGRSRHPKAPPATNFLQPVCRELAPSPGTTIRL